MREENPLGEAETERRRNSLIFNLSALQKRERLMASIWWRRNYMRKSANKNVFKHICHLIDIAGAFINAIGTAPQPSATLSVTTNCGDT